MEKKSKILIFAGTTEGRELAEFLSERESRPRFPWRRSTVRPFSHPDLFLKIHQGRMEEGEMEAFFPGRKRSEPWWMQPTLTRWWFRKISREACTHTGTEYIRLLREQSTDTADCIFVEDTAGSRGVSETDGGQRASDDRKQGAESLHGSSGF